MRYLDWCTVCSTVTAKHKAKHSSFFFLELNSTVMGVMMSYFFWLPAYLVQHRLPLGPTHLEAGGGRCGLSEAQCDSGGWRVEAAMASHGRSWCSGSGCTSRACSIWISNQNKHYWGESHRGRGEGGWNTHVRNTPNIAQDTCLQI